MIADLRRLERSLGGPGGHVTLWTVGDSDTDLYLAALLEFGGSYRVRVVLFEGAPTVVVSDRTVTDSELRELERLYKATRPRDPKAKRKPRRTKKGHR